MQRSEETWRFAAQFLFSAIVLVFCIYKLSIAGENQNTNALYWGGITSILAWWMPSPGAQRSASIHANAVNIEQLTDSIEKSPLKTNSKN
jgi:hypothetical protein